MASSASFRHVFAAREDARSFFASEVAAESLQAVVEGSDGQPTVVEFTADRHHSSNELLGVGVRALRRANARDLAEARA